MSATISVEVAFALPQRQELLTVELPLGATAEDAIVESGIYDRFPGIDLGALAIGVWGRPVEPHKPLRDGDRVELYRDLEIDPREARRQRALAGKTMSRPED